MKTRELSLGEKQAILKLRKEGKSEHKHSLYNNNLECPEKERNRWRTEQQRSNRKKTAVDDRNIVRDLNGKKTKY